MLTNGATRLARMHGPRSAVAWTGDAIEIIDQTLLPAEERMLRLTTPARWSTRSSAWPCAARRRSACAARSASCWRMRRAHSGAAAERDRRRTADRGQPALGRRARAARGAGPRRLAADEAEALAILDEDTRRRAERDGRARAAPSSPARARLLTVCNTGRLATAGLGTALALVYAKAVAGEPVEVFACETRPLLQGARLTAWELTDAGIPVTVLADGAARDAARRRAGSTR